MRWLASLVSIVNLFIIPVLLYVNSLNSSNDTGAGLALCAITVCIIFIMGLFNIIMHLCLIFLFKNSENKSMTFPKDILFLSFCGFYYLFDKEAPIFSLLLISIMIIISSFTLNLLGYLIMLLLYANKD